MPDSKGLAHLRINAAGYGLNAMFDIEDDVARSAAQSNHDAITDLAQQLAGDEADIVALQNKDAEIDATILQIDARDDGQDTQINALQDKTQLYSVVSGENVNHRILQIGTGLEVNNNVLRVTGGGSGGDISALTARVEALETNDGVQDGEISTLQTTVNTLGTVQTSQGNAITALQTSDSTQNTDIAGIKATLQAADLSGMATRLTAVEVKNAQQDTAIANKSDVHVGAMGNTIPEVHLDGDQFTGDYQTGAVAINTVWMHNTIAGDTAVTGLGTRVGDLEAHDIVQDGQIQQIINSGIQYKTALRTQETREGQIVDVNHDIVYVEGDLTIAEGTGEREILKMNPNGALMTDINGLKNRMDTAENDIDALEANDVTFSLEKTGLYTSSGGTNTYYTDLALGTGLAVTNGVLDVVGGGGGGGFSQCTAIADANDATTPGLYCPASSSATNFPAGADITDLHSGTLIVSTYGSGHNKTLIQQVYIENYNGSSASAQLGNAKIWLRVQSNNHSDWPFPSDDTSFKSWQLVASATEDYVQDIVYAKDGISLVSTSHADPTNWPADLANQSVYAIVITMTTDNNIAGSFDGTQVLITDSGKSYVRTKWQGSWLTWIAISGGGSTGPTKIAAGTDLDTITTEGEYYFNGGYMTNMPKWPGMVAPASGEGNMPYFLVVRKRPYGGDSGTTYLIEQEIIATDSATIGFVTSTKNTIRHISRVQINNGSWSSWVSQDTAMTCTDCNLACRTGKYWINDSTSNRPSGMGSGVTGVMDVTYEFGGSTTYTCIQKITTASAIYVRNNTNSAYSQQGNWNAWKSVALS